MNKRLRSIWIVALCFFQLQVHSQTINELLQKAVQNNPLLHAIELEYEAMLLGAEQEKQLPDPQLGIAVPILRPETRLGAQVVTVQASQMFPWFGTLQAKENVKISMAKTQYEKLALERLNLFYQIKSAYYQLYLIDQKKAIIEDNIRLFETLERVALAKVESGKSISSDVLKIKLKVAELENVLKVLDSKKPALFASINEATGSNISDSIMVTETLDSIAFIDFDLNNFQEILFAHHPLIKQLDWQIETSQEKQALNKLNGMPSFGVGLDYSAVRERTDAFPMNNGRDILIPKVMVSIPINRKKYKAKDKEEALYQEAITLRKEDEVNEMLMHLQGVKSLYDENVLHIQLIAQQKIIAESAYSILLSEYSSKGNRFDELIQILSQLYEYDIAILTARVNTFEAKAQIDRLTDF